MRFQEGQFIPFQSLVETQILIGIGNVAGNILLCLSNVGRESKHLGAV